MKKCSALLLAILLLAAAGTAAAGWQNVLNGLIVPSAESCMADVPPCDDVSHEAKYYTYRYAGCGEEYNGVGSNAIWAQFEAYAQYLGALDAYEVMDHEITDFGRNTWYLRYTGPEEVAQFQPEVIYDGHCAIMVRSYKGNVIVFYSNDVATGDLKETMRRFGMPVPETKVKENTGAEIMHFDVSALAHSFDNGTATPAAPAADMPAPATSAPAVKPAPVELRECEICEEGSCKRCGGDGYAYRTVLNIRTGKHETVNERCTAQLCLNGSCTACGGDGWLGN